MRRAQRIGSRQEALIIRPAFEQDVGLLAPRLRKADLAELAAIGRKSAEEALRIGLTGDACYSVEIAGQVEAMFGVRRTRDKPIFGWIWFLGSDGIPFGGPQTHRLTQQWLEIVAEGCDMTGNTILVEQEVHKRWLKHLGYSFTSPRPHPKTGCLVQFFYKEH